LPSDIDLLLHIRDEMEFLLHESKRMSLEIFLSDETEKRAFARSLEVIGEAVKGISSSLILKHPGVEWRNMAGMRDKLIHTYFSIDYAIVWDVAVNKIPLLLQKIEKIIGSL